MRVHSLRVLDPPVLDTTQLHYPLSARTCHDLLSPKGLWGTLSLLSLLKFPLEARLG